MKGRTFYIAEVNWVDGRLIASGYPEGVIPVGTRFTRAETVNLVQGDTIIKADPPPAPRAVDVKVVNILSYDQELPELSELTGGHLILDGEGIDVLQRGMQLFE